MLDSPDLVWRQVYLLLRSGQGIDATSLLEEHKSALRADEIASWLRRWVADNGRLPSDLMARAADRARRMLALGGISGDGGEDGARGAGVGGEGRGGAQRGGADARSGGAAEDVASRSAHCTLLVVVLSGRLSLHDRFLADHRSFFGSIEDFLWFKLAMVDRWGGDVDGVDSGGGMRPMPGSGLAAGGAGPSGLASDGGGGLLSAAEASDLDAASRSVSVRDVQGRLNEFGPRHYTRDGRRPLLYVAVLLLSVQASLTSPRCTHVFLLRHPLFLPRLPHRSPP